MLKSKSIYLVFCTLIICLFITGCGSKDVSIDNIPFDTIDKNDFTLEALTNKIESPFLIATDNPTKLKSAYSNIRKNELSDQLNINEEIDLALVVFRGKNGSCKNADIRIKKISREQKSLKVEVTIDKNQKVQENECETVMNPYTIVRLNKESIEYNKKIKNIKLINSANQEIFYTTKINHIPNILK